MSEFASGLRENEGESISMMIKIRNEDNDYDEDDSSPERQSGGNKNRCFSRR